MKNLALWCFGILALWLAKFAILPHYLNSTTPIALCFQTVFGVTKDSNQEIPMLVPYFLFF